MESSGEATVPSTDIAISVHGRHLRAGARLALAILLVAGCGGDDALPVCASREIAASVECTSQGQLCEPLLHHVCEGGDGRLQAEFIASPQHCSDIRFTLAVDGAAQAPSAFLTPGASTGLLDFGDLTEGRHDITVQAEGRPGGCNTGRLGSWVGTLKLIVTP
jgi:hypothetical protein